MAKFYLTSAIPYVNAAPHIGHAQEFVYSDVIRRFRMLLGYTVTYLCGADENALKIVQAAEKAKQNPQEFTDIHQKEFLDLAQKLSVHFDIWQRGTDQIHHFASSQKLWKLCEKNGDIYKKSYTGLYCVGCEQFYPKEELNEHGECYEHPGRKLEQVSEENYFFSLSKYQSFIENLLESDTLKILPKIRKNEALAFVRRGLEDFSISRSTKRAKGWGVPVPGDSDQIMYVWFDALNIYQTGIGFGYDQTLFDTWAGQDCMVIGKGILRFHVVYWPAILTSAGLPLPKSCFSHGYLTVDGQKMSKTLGNVVDPMTIITKYGSDAVRYYLLKEIPSYSDGDYSERRFKEVYNSDLAGGLGNLVARVAKLAEKASSLNTKTYNYKVVCKDVCKTELEEFRFNDALANIWKKMKEADQFIDTNEPWKLEGKGLTRIIEDASNRIVEIATLLEPFMPDTSSKIIKQFTSKKIISGPALFPRII
ncbi:methionine--tRNA ligase [Candidatus Gottesmanbacteria bacterium]|nr:methionine--tRNA ligase [Candidatus Gottesmanbacteria bacterium]